MALVRFLMNLLTFVGALESASALMLTVILMLRLPPFLITLVVACLLFCIV